MAANRLWDLIINLLILINCLLRYFCLAYWYYIYERFVAHLIAHTLARGKRLIAILCLVVDIDVDQITARVRQTGDAIIWACELQFSTHVRFPLTYTYAVKLVKLLHTHVQAWLEAHGSAVDGY